MHRSPLSMIAVAAAVVAFGVAGCGSDDDSGDSGGSATNAADNGGGAYGGGGTKSSGGGGEKITLSADPGGELKFDKSTLTAKAGKVTIDLDNPSSATAPHAVEVEGNGVEEETKTIEPGKQGLGDGRPRARQVRVLLPGRRPPASRHGRNPDGPVGGPRRVARRGRRAYFSNRDSRRSLSTRPPVCSSGQ